jgi:transposase
MNAMSVREAQHDGATMPIRVAVLLLSNRGPRTRGSSSARNDRYVNFDFVREKLKPFYSATRRPSIDPERLLILLIEYLYGVTIERKLIEELRMHLAWS